MLCVYPYYINDRAKMYANYEKSCVIRQDFFFLYIFLSFRVLCARLNIGAKKS